VRETLEQASIAAVATSERQRLEQARNPTANHASAIPAGLLAESAGDPALADAGGPGDQKSFGAVDPVAGDEPLEQGAVDAARRSQVDVLDDGVLPQRGELEARGLTIDANRSRRSGCFSRNAKNSSSLSFVVAICWTPPRKSPLHGNLAASTSERDAAKPSIWVVPIS
jgi:hypothetical protein